MTRSITLIRHGLPNADRTHTMSALQFNDWLQEYDTAGIVTPQSNIAMNDLIGNGAVLCCSDLKRSLETAAILFPTHPVDYVSEQFKEITFPHIYLPFLRLRVKQWMVLSRGLWLLGYLNPRSSFWSERQRVDRAVQWIVQQSLETPVIVVAHGFLNTLIARELRTLKFSGPRFPPSAFLSVSHYHPLPDKHMSNRKGR